MSAIYIQGLARGRICANCEDGREFHPTVYALGVYDRARWHRFVGYNLCAYHAWLRAHEEVKAGRVSEVRARPSYSLPEWMLWPETARLRFPKGSRLMPALVKRDGLALCYNAVHDCLSITHVRSGAQCGTITHSDSYHNGVLQTEAVKRVFEAILAGPFDWTMRSRFLTKSARVQVFMTHEIFPLRNSLLRESA